MSGAIINVISKQAGQQKDEYNDRIYFFTKKDSFWHIGCVENGDLWKNFKTLKEAKQYMVESI